MADPLINAIVAELVRLHETGGEVSPFSERYAELTPAAGYRAAAQLHAHRMTQGWRPAGRKIGFTNRTLWTRYGVYEPMWGMVYDRTLVHSQAGRARVALAGLAQPRIEPEVCFRLASVPPRGTTDPRALLASIDWVAHAIEIVQCHHPGWQVKIADCTADNGLHGRLVLGTPVPAAKLPELAERLPALEVTLRCADRVVDRGVGANVLDSPLNALAVLIALLAKQPEAPPLAAGEIITTGVLTDAHRVAPGETWSTTFDGLPLAGLEVTFE